MFMRMWIAHPQQSEDSGRTDKNDDRHSRDRKGRDSRDGDGSGVENDLESVTI